MAWNDLTIPQRSQLMNIYRQNGITSLSEMKRLYDLSSPFLVETDRTALNNVAPMYAQGGPKSKGKMIPPQGVDEYSQDFIGPVLPKSAYNGPEVPYGFYDAPIDWERKKALQHYNESSFKANQVSPAGAMGPYQIMPKNWETYSKKLGLTGTAQDYNNSEAVRDKMMEELLQAKWVNKGFPSDSVRAAKALMGYNWGSGNATKFLENMKNQGVDIYHSMDWIDKIPAKETRNYVNYILRERNIPGGKTIEAFEKALPHRFDALKSANRYAGGGPENVKGYAWDPLNGILPDTDEYYDPSLTEPAVVTAALPAKFNGSQASARRYAEGYKFGQRVNEKRDEWLKNEGAAIAGLSFGVPAAAVGLVTNPLPFVAGIVGAKVGENVGRRIDERKGPIIGGLVGGIAGGVSGEGAKIAYNAGKTYVNGVLDRTAEAVLRMGDAARDSGTLGRRVIKTLKNTKLNLNSRIKQANLLMSRYKELGSVSKQFLDKNTLNYIFNPKADPDLAYNMPFKYSGESPDTFGHDFLSGSTAHKGDVIDQFLGKTQPRKYEYVNVDDLPSEINGIKDFNFKKYFKKNYPNLNKVRVVRLGTAKKQYENALHLPTNLSEVNVGETKHAILNSAEIRAYFSGKPMLDPGHYHSYITNVGNNSFVAENFDVYKYKPSDFANTWHGFNTDVFSKLKLKGLQFIDSRGEPLIYKWSNDVIPTFSSGDNLFWPGGKKKTLFNKQKVLNRVYGDAQAFAEGNAGIQSSVWQYLFNKDNAVDKRIEDAELGAEKYRSILESGDPNLIYRTFRDLPKDEQRLFDLGRMVDVIKQHEDAKRLYLGYEPKYGTIERSKNKPTIGKSDNPYQINALLTDSKFDNLIVPLWSQWRTGIGDTVPVSEGYLGLKYSQKPRTEDKGKVALVKNLPFISDATMSEGFDDKGQYLSIYDIWDYNTNYINTPGDNVGKFVGGKPFEIYQRYYLDDWFDIPEEERGYPYIAPAYVTSEKARGGKIHIKKKNRGKFTALKKRTGHSASWFKAHGTPAQKKMAVFALNARKWKHSHGGIIF